MRAHFIAALEQLHLECFEVVIIKRIIITPFFFGNFFLIILLCIMHTFLPKFFREK